MKIAIFHDYMDSIGGGEKLVLELAKELNADIYTTSINKDNLKRINEHNVTVKLLRKSSQIPILKQISASKIFYDSQLSGYDFYIMSGNWSIFACHNHHPNLYYVHTPPRMFYDSKSFFYEIAPWYAKWPFLLWVRFHKSAVEKQLKYVNTFVANSSNVQKRITKYWHKQSVVVNPPIKQYKFKKYGDFYLAVNRIYPHKRIDLLIEVFRNLSNEKLVLVGGHMKGDHSRVYAKKVLINLPPNIKLLGEVNEKEIAKLYGECKAFITLSKDEDFGMTILEANSAGKTVIATNEGGHKETILHGKTGYLVKPDVVEILKKVKKISDNPKKFKDACIKQARVFSVDIFSKKIKKELGIRELDIRELDIRN